MKTAKKKRFRVMSVFMCFLILISGILVIMGSIRSNQVAAANEITFYFDSSCLGKKDEWGTKTPDHVYFYAMEENYHHIEPYYRNGEKADFTERFREWYSQEDHSFTLEQFIDRFRDRHKDIYVGVLDSEVNRELGLWCVKAVIPTMLTMTFGVKNQRLNLDRIRKGAVEAGILDREIPEEEINTTPHPFP